MKLGKHKGIQIIAVICIISILAFVTFLSGYVSFDGTKSYNESGIYFNYPAGWIKTSIPTPPNNDGIEDVVFIKKRITNTEVGLDSALLGISRQGAGGKTIEYWKNTTKTPKSYAKVDRVISETSITVDGVKGYQIKGIYQSNSVDSPGDTQDIIFVKNDMFYRIFICTTKEGSMKYVQSDVDVIIRSFHIV